MHSTSMVALPVQSGLQSEPNEWSDINRLEHKKEVYFNVSCLKQNATLGIEQSFIFQTRASSTKDEPKQQRSSDNPNSST